MADKKFGVKQLNLIGASGTPVITSPNTVSYTHPPSPRDATLSRMPSSA